MGKGRGGVWTAAAEKRKEFNRGRSRKGRDVARTVSLKMEC